MSPTEQAQVTGAALPAAEPEETPTPAVGPSGEAAETWDYVALGDSLTFSSTWPDEYSAHIEEDVGVAVELQNLGRPGTGDGTILALLQRDESLRDLVRKAEVITVNGGTNALGGAVRRYRENACEGEDNQECSREMVEGSGRTRMPSSMRSSRCDVPNKR